MSLELLNAQIKKQDNVILGFKDNFIFNIGLNKGPVIKNNEAFIINTLGIGI